MALYKGLNKCRFCKGNLRPAALYLGDKQIAGAVPDTVSGDGRIEYTSPYKGPFKSVTVSGNAKQEQYEGYNMLDLSKTTFLHCKLQDDGTIVSDINNYYYCEINIFSMNDYLLANAGKTISFTIDGKPPDSYIGIVIYGTRTTVTTPYQSVRETTSNCVSLTIADDFEEITDIRLRFNAKDTSFTDTTTVFSNPMFLAGSYTAETLPEYEPYTGGEIVEPYNMFKEMDDYYIVAKQDFYNGDVITLAFDATVSMDETIKITYGEMTGFETVAFEGDVVGDGVEEYHIKASFTIDIDGWSDASTVGKTFKVYNASSISNVKVFWGSDTPEYSYQPYPAPNAYYPIQPEFSAPQIAGRSNNPYFDGGSTQCPELYAMPDGSYQDTMEIQSGKITRHVQKIVLDGTENWLTPSSASIYGMYIFYLKLDSPSLAGTSTCYCTHFTYHGAWSNAYVQDNAVKIHTVNGTSMIYIAQGTYSSLDVWKKFLAEQYASGTPFTVWYVLAEPIVETVDVTPLEMSGGYGQIIQTDLGLTVPIEVKYYKEYQDR